LQIRTSIFYGYHKNAQFDEFEFSKKNCIVIPKQIKIESRKAELITCKIYLVKEHDTGAEFKAYENGPPSRLF
jgi:hypothetical protein